MQTVGGHCECDYAAPRRIARFAALMARNGFPTLNMYRPL